MAELGSRTVKGYFLQTNKYKNYHKKCGDCKGAGCYSGDHAYEQTTCVFLCPRKSECMKPDPKSCAIVGGNKGSGRFPDEGSAKLVCTYKNSDFKTDADVQAFINKFIVKENYAGTVGSSRTTLNSHILPYFCAQGDNITKDRCKAFCNNKWSSNASCALSLEHQCKKADNAVNLDFCYAHCNNPAGGKRPYWCDTQMKAVCDLMVVKVENFSIVKKRRVFLLLVAIALVYLLYFYLR